MYCLKKKKIPAPSASENGQKANSLSKENQFKRSVLGNVSGSPRVKALNKKTEDEKQKTGVRTHCEKNAHLHPRTGSNLVSTCVSIIIIIIITLLLLGSSSIHPRPWSAIG